MKKKQLLALLSLLYSLVTYSQQEFIPGYILKTESDTIYGQLNYGTDYKNSTECLFRASDSSTIQNYSPDQIYGFRFTNGKNYISKAIKPGKGETKNVFVEYLVSGLVNLYYYRDEANEDHYYIDKTNLPINEISISDKFYEVDGHIYKKNVLIKRPVLKYYLEDCPELFKKIDALVFCEHSSLIALISRYHELRCPDKICYIYKKQMPKFRLDIEVTAGSKIVTNPIKMETSGYQFGINAFIWLPLDNEKLFLRTGLLINKFNDENGYIFSTIKKSKSVLYVPLQLHYQFSNKKFTTTFGGGANLYLGWILPALNMGLKYQLTKRTSVGLNYELESASPLIIMPLGDIHQYGHSLNIGVRYRL